MSVADRALQYIQDGHVVGLGTGRAATAFIRALGERVQAGLKVRGVPTSQASADLAEQLGIPLATLDEIDTIDVAVDGADEVDPRLDLIKGLGGALVREKIVAAAARQFLVVVTGTDKLVPTLGARGILPVEVVPFALPFCRRRLDLLGCRPEQRLRDGRPYVTDNGNLILDCHIGPIAEADRLEQAILAIPGIIDTGLFLGMAHAVLIEDGDQVHVRERHPM
jgi:ribose 5-phosphate isomerase A